MANQEQNTNKEKKQLTVAQKKMQHGVKATVISLVVIIALIAVNIFVSNKQWSYDLTSNSLYTLSKQSKSIVKSLKEDQKVTLYVLEKESNFTGVYKNIVSQYKKAGKNVTVEYKDPEIYPNFEKDYVTDGTKAEQGSIIVVCGKKSKLISSSEYASSSYDQSGKTEVNVNLEPKITSAINTVVETKTPVIYNLTGHGEGTLGTNFSSALTNDNYAVTDLDLVAKGGIPDDCSMILINAPSKDLTEDNINTIKKYMSDGGKIIVVLNPFAETKNLNAFLKEYNVEVQKGLVVELGSGYYAGNYPTYLLPTLGQNEITTPISDAGLRVVAPISKGLIATNDRDNSAANQDYTVSNLLMTSTESYSKVNTESKTIEKEKNDIDGAFAVAQAVDDKDGGKLVVIGSSELLNDDMDNQVSNANSNFFSNSVNYLAKQENKISVRSKVLSQNYAVFSGFATKLVTALGIVVIPLIILAIGVVVLIRRRLS